LNRASFRPDFEKWWLICILGIYLPAVAAYGWRIVLMGAMAALAGWLTSMAGCCLRGAPLELRGCPVWVLLPLALPPAVPWWVPAAGAVFGEAVVRQLFGGYGRNLVNPVAVAVVFLGISYPAIVTQADLMPGLNPAAGFTSWVHSGPACPAVPENGSASNLLLARLPVLPGDCSAALVAICLVLLWKRRALHASFPLGALLGLALAGALRLAVNPAAAPAVVELIVGGGFMTALAAAGLDVFSLSRTPAMRLPAGIILGVLSVVLWSSGAAVPPAFAALLLVNVLTPLGDALIVSWRARQWIVTGGRPA